MPLYDYECLACGTFEARHSMFAPNLRRCPTCKGKVEKLVSVPAMRMGNDWSTENGGRGQFITQIADSTTDASAYCRNPAELVEKAKQKGFTKITKC